MGYLLFLLGLSLFAFQCQSACPPYREGGLCSCARSGVETWVFCRNANHSEELYQEIRQFEGYDIDELNLINVDLEFLWMGLFAGTSVRRLNIDESRLQNLYAVGRSRPTPFDGLEDSLEEINIYKTTDLRRWYWPDMSDLRRLKKFTIVKSPIDYVGHIFAEMGRGSIEVIRVVDSGVNSVHPQAFPEMKDIREADFSGNNLHYLVRLMLPDPAPKLQILNFRRNQLFTVNENMFSNMPALSHLDLSYNKFTTFESVAYRPIAGQLDRFYMSHNPIKCDCSLVTMRDYHLTDYKEVTCTTEDNKEISVAGYVTSHPQCTA